MPFITLPGFKGKLYVPENDPECLRKHGCKHCFSCQMCSDDRCALCLKNDFINGEPIKKPLISGRTNRNKANERT